MKFTLKLLKSTADLLTPMGLFYLEMELFNENCKNKKIQAAMFVQCRERLKIVYNAGT
jgi:hypothetical protein